MADKRITETNPGFIGPRRRWYDKIRDEFTALEKELDPITEAYSSLEQRIQQEESAPEFLPTLESAISFAYAVAQHYSALEKLPKLLCQYAKPLARHLKDVKTEKGELDKKLWRRGECIFDDLMEWKERFEQLYESHWYRKGLHQQVEDFLQLVQQGKSLPDKYHQKIKNAWYGGMLHPGMQKNMISLLVLVEELSAYQLRLDPKIDEKYGQPFAGLSRKWKEKETI